MSYYITKLDLRLGILRLLGGLIFTSWSTHSVRIANPKIALRFPCLCVCLFVHPHLSRAQYITSYVTMQLQCIATFGGLQVKLQQMKVVVCCLDGENLVGSLKDPVYVAAYTVFPRSDAAATIYFIARFPAATIRGRPLIEGGVY